jgi:hypothetical protein
LVPETAERVRLANVAFKPLVGFDEVTADLLLAWRTQTDNPALAAAVGHVSQALQDSAWLT